MEGKQKLFYLPEPHTDFIYGVPSEEPGLVGAVLAAAVTTVIVLQAFFKISVVLARLPTKGIPLPFISYLLCRIVLASVGALLNITQQTE